VVHLDITTKLRTRLVCVYKDNLIHDKRVCG
jgi:hypothetical protein